MVPRIAGTVVDLWFIQCLHRGCSSVVHYNELTKTNEYTGYDNDRLRHIRLHEQVNELPDPNYATLKFFMGHLDRYVMMTLRPRWTRIKLMTRSEYGERNLSIRCLFPT